jgi:hypothetical protein
MFKDIKDAQLKGELLKMSNRIKNKCGEHDKKYGIFTDWIKYDAIINKIWAYQKAVNLFTKKSEKNSKKKQEMLMKTLNTCDNLVMGLINNGNILHNIVKKPLEAELYYNEVLIYIRRWLEIAKKYDKINEEKIAKNIYAKIGEQLKKIFGDKTGEEEKKIGKIRSALLEIYKNELSTTKKKLDKSKKLTNK